MEPLKSRPRHDFQTDGEDSNKPAIVSARVARQLRFWLVALALVPAGWLAAQGRRPISLGSLPSDTIVFAVLVLATIALVGALSFLPALALGPLMEFLQS